MCGNPLVERCLFPEDAVIAPSSEVTRETIRAINPEGGASIVVEERVTETTISYEIPVLTPSEQVRSLHNGAPAVAMTDPDFAGISVTPFTPGASILGRMVVIAKRPGTSADRMFRVFWHPRAALQSNGLGESQGEQTLLFKASVRAHTYTPAARFADVNTQITQYGAIFGVPARTLNDLLTALDTEAAT
ncbi:hypothetical protein [Deinococcus sp.]|uniref:hypothetical protein n=1 Tax=Deinococcus sp. TaxID=47478 RepID=UPI0025BB7DFC|nr:hypothetical protein [Deinococcus sp.]